jgi:hypothetical protein
MAAKRKKPAPDKPKLAIVKGVTVEDIVAMYTALTGKQPSPEEVEEARRDLEGRAAGGTTQPRPPNGN